MDLLEDEQGCGVIEDDEVLPFALHDTTTTQPLHQNASARPTGLESAQQKYGCSMMSVSLSSYNDQQNPPGLVSSMMSCQTDASAQSSASSSVMSNFPPTKHLRGDWGSALLSASTRDGPMLSSQHLDVAASLIAGMENSLAIQQDDVGLDNHKVPNLPSSHAAAAQPTSTAFSSMGFSQLLDNAGGDAPCHANHGDLPVLPEETILDGSSSAQMESFHSAHGGSTSFPTNIATTTSQTIPSDWIPINSPQNEASFREQQRAYQPPSLDGYSSLGATITGPSRRLGHGLSRKAVSARRLDATSFEVSIEMDRGLSVADVMEIIGNPSYLQLWCESVRSLVVTKSSEGARNAENRQGSSSSSGFSGNRNTMRAEYEGEWIEATTTDLISPPSASSCLYSTSRAMWNYVGFPSNYGTVSMFVERLKGRTGITIGPFAGDITASHTITVVKEPRTTRIVDRVVLSRGSESPELVCGVFECLESCLLPSLKGYMDQVVSSMIRLRALVETAEGCHSPTQIVEDFELLCP